ncbi:MAG: NUDIX domain-containing protein [Candidatus Omnitrophota bacterium]
MKIRDTEIKIIKGKIGCCPADMVAKDIQVGDDPQLEQESIRRAAAQALQRAQGSEARSVVFPALGCQGGRFPVAGSAKILAQEILKFLKQGRTKLAEIIICVEDERTFQLFEETLRGYVNHVQTRLGDEPYVTVDIIIETDQGIILIERSNPPYGWALPGGFLDPGESLEEAAMREAKEETNLELVNLRQLHTYSQPGRDPRFHTISTVFIATGKGQPRSGDDAKSLKIVKRSDLLELEYAFDHKGIIGDYLRKVTPDKA